MLAGPIARQVMGSNIRWLRDWAMFGGFGRRVIDVRFFAASAGVLRPVQPQWETVERAALFGDLKSFPSDQDVAKAAQGLCRSLGPDADIRVMTRHATPSGWSGLAGGSVNRCEGSSVP